MTVSSVECVVGDEGNVTICITGRFDYSVHRDFRNYYKDVRSADARFFIDLSQTDYVDSSALGMLLLLREHVHGDVSRIAIVGASPGVSKILRIARFDVLFDI